MVFDVTSYGALGDGVTDDTVAINSTIAAMNGATAGVLYFPAGTYITTGGLTSISAGGIVEGEGTTRGTTATAYTGTMIVSSSPSNSLFTITSDRLVFRDLALSNSSVSIPTSGAGITVTGSGDVGTRVDYENVYVEKFYNNIEVQVGFHWTMRSCFIQDAVNYGIRIRNTVNGDAGDWSISDSAFYAATRNAAAAIRIESSGGGKITNSKINRNGTLGTGKWTRGIDVTPSVATSVLLISNNSIENVGGVPIWIGNSALYSLISINGNEFGLYGGNGSQAINITGQSNISIANNLIKTTSAGVNAIVLNTCDNVRISGNVVSGYSTIVSATAVTNLVNLNYTIK
jgi:hypothetical protein